jgi:DNA-directed RNA polymerases I, II, and III subunit RPABC2
LTHVQPAKPAHTTEMADLALDEYNEALDHMAPEAEGGPEEPEDTGETALDTAKALGVTEAPSAKTQVLLDQHPEIWPDYEETVLEKLVIRDAYPPTEDAVHTTYPYLTLYEKTKVLSLRASQLARGAPPFIDVPEYLTDVYEIARAELEAKRLPYILKRPLPDGEFEYWRLADLMIL